MNDDVVEWGRERPATSARRKVVAVLALAAVTGVAGVSYAARHPAAPPRPPVAAGPTATPASPTAAPTASPTATPTSPQPAKTTTPGLSLVARPGARDSDCTTFLRTVGFPDQATLGLREISDTLANDMRVRTFVRANDQRSLATVRGTETVRITSLCSGDVAGTSSGGMTGSSAVDVGDERWIVDAGQPIFGYAGWRPATIAWQAARMAGVWIEVSASTPAGPPSAGEMRALAAAVSYDGRSVVSTALGRGTARPPTISTANAEVDCLSFLQTLAVQQADLLHLVPDADTVIGQTREMTFSHGAERIRLNANCWNITFRLRPGPAAGDDNADSRFFVDKGDRSASGAVRPASVTWQTGESPALWVSLQSVAGRGPGSADYLLLVAHHLTYLGRAA